MGAMEIRILEEGTNNLKIEVEDGNNMIFNILNAELWQDNNVKAAGFHQDHPLINKVVFIVETKKGSSPRDAIKNALKRVEKEADEFSKKAAKVL